MQTPLQKLGIGSALQAVRLITTLENITELLAAAIKGDETIIPTNAAAWDISIDAATASSELSQIYKALRNPPTQLPRLKK